MTHGGASIYTPSIQGRRVQTRVGHDIGPLLHVDILDRRHDQSTKDLADVFPRETTGPANVQSTFESLQNIRRLPYISMLTIVPFTCVQAFHLEFQTHVQTRGALQ